MRKEGLEIQKPRGEEGKRRQRQRQARSGMGPSGGDWSAAPHPRPGPPGLQSPAEITDIDRQGPPPPQRTGSGALDAARHPRGSG